MRVAVAVDERTGIADAVVAELRRRGHEPILHGALSDAERDDWAWASEAAARDVADGRAELVEILDAWFAGQPSGEEEDRANVAHVIAIDDAPDDQSDA